MIGANRLNVIFAPIIEIIKGKNAQAYLELTTSHLEGDKRRKQHFEDCACVFHSYPRNEQYNHLDNLKQVLARRKLTAIFS